MIGDSDAGRSRSVRHPGDIVLRARLVVFGLTCGVLAFAGISDFIELPARFPALVAPAALAGLVSPVIGYRLYSWRRERQNNGVSVESRCHAFLQATIVAAAVTEGVALFGVVAYLLSGEIAALIGVVTHVILAGAIWPTPARLADFTGDPDSPPRGA